MAQKFIFLKEFCILANDHNDKKSYALNITPELF